MSLPALISARAALALGDSSKKGHDREMGVIACSCLRGEYDDAQYSSCYECFRERRSHYVTCISCGVRWHNPEYAHCFHCSGRGAGKVEREEAARAVRQYVMWRDNGRCAWCEGRGDQVDHILPCAHGGTAHRWNLQAMCRECNELKGASWYWGSPWLFKRDLLVAEYFLNAEWKMFLTDEEREALPTEVRKLRTRYQWPHQNPEAAWERARQRLRSQLADASMTQSVDLAPVDWAEAWAS